MHAGNLFDRARSRLSGEIATNLLYSHAKAAAINNNVGPMVTVSSVKAVNNTVIPSTTGYEATDGQ